MVQETSAPVSGDGAPPLAEVSGFGDSQPVEAEVKEPVQSEPETEAQEPAEPTGEPEAEAEGEAEPETWGSAYERYKETEDFKAFLERERRAAHREGHIKGQQREAGQRKQVLEAAAQAQAVFPSVASGLKSLNAAITQAVEDGSLDGATFQATMQRFAPDLMKAGQFYDNINKILVHEANRLSDAGQRHAGAVAIKTIALHPDINDEKLGQQFLERFWQDFEGYDGGNEAFKEFIDEVVDRIKEKAKKPVEKELAKAETAIIKGKVAARQTGPDTAAKSGGSKTPDQELMDPNTPVERLMEIRRQQRAG